MRPNRLLLGATLLLPALFAACGESATTPPAPAAKSSPPPATSAAAPEESEPVAAEDDDTVEPALVSLKTEYDLSALASTLNETDGAPRPDEGRATDPPGALLDSGGAGATDADGSGLVRAQLRYTGGINLAEGEEKSWDFGKIREGDLREKIFELVSDGPEALIIKGVKPSCGCTKAEVEIYGEDGSLTPYKRGEEIPTGTRFRLVTEVSAEGKQGAFGTSVSIYTNAPGGTFNVRLAAIAEPILTVTPEPTIFFGEMTTADQMTQTVQVKSEQGEPFLLKAVANGLPEAVKMSLAPVEPDENGKATAWDVTVVAGPGLPAGIRNYPCAVRSDIELKNPKHPKPDGSPTFYTISLGVQARVTGMVNATPAFLGFGMVRPGQEVERTVLIESHDDFKLTADIPVSFEGLYGGEFEYAHLLETELVPSDEGDAMEIRLKLTGLPEDATGSFGGILKVGVGHPSIEELVVRFSGVCRLGLPGGSGN